MPLQRLAAGSASGEDDQLCSQLLDLGAQLINAPQRRIDTSCPAVDSSMFPGAGRPLSTDHRFLVSKGPRQNNWATAAARRGARPSACSAIDARPPNFSTAAGMVAHHGDRPRSAGQHRNSMRVWDQRFGTVRCSVTVPSSGKEVRMLDRIRPVSTFIRAAAIP